MTKSLNLIGFFATIPRANSREKASHPPITTALFRQKRAVFFALKRFAFLIKQHAEHNLPAENESRGGQAAQKVGDDQSTDGFDDGDDEIGLAVIDPAVRQQVRPEDHGVDHEHGVRPPVKGPHGDQEIQQLVQRGKNDQAVERVAGFPENVRFQQFGEEGGQRDQQAAANEGHQVCGPQVRGRNPAQQDQRPDDHGSEDEGQAFFLAILHILFQPVQPVNTGVQFI